MKCDLWVRIRGQRSGDELSIESAATIGDEHGAL